MSNTNTGGPAFPVLHWINGESTGAEEGMTLRDYFAADAMKAYLILEKNQAAPPGSVAFIAYQMADAMLQARGA